MACSLSIVTTDSFLREPTQVTTNAFRCSNPRSVSDAACIKTTLSKFLSYVVLAGSIIIKVPQILNLIKPSAAPKSGKKGAVPVKEDSGLSETMYILEIIG